MSEAIWNEVECGDYTADLPLWEELADALGGDEAIMELGCGVGRVTLHLAARDARLVIGVDREPELVEAVWERGHPIGADAEIEDVRDFELPGAKFGLVLAPMQLIQLLGGSEERVACLTCVHDAMLPGGRAAFALVERLTPEPAPGSPPPLPDVRQVEGWIYSSLPLETIVGPGSIVVRRLRQTVDPGGEMSEVLNELELAMFSAETLEDEAGLAGLRPAGRREIPATETHMGSTVVLLERGA